MSYGFIDPNFPLNIPTLSNFVYQERMWAAGLYAIIVLLLFAVYKNVKVIERWMILVVLLMLLSFPALSYDIFNYILTAKVAFFYHENPYVVMPIEIPGEPMLAFTRAANKFALYGPTWLAMTLLPHIVGRGNILLTIYTFKAFVLGFFAIMCYFIYKKTKRWDQVLFFAANPLVFIEVLGSGHNDVVMMVLAIAGLLLWHRKQPAQKIAGVMLFAASIFVKGATLVLVPLFFLPFWKWEKKMIVGFWLMFLVFLMTPLREEMYPWYAVWWLSFAAFIPIKKNSLVHGFSFWLSLGLMLRYVPWIATREYGGVTPIVREIVTIVPVAVYVFKHFVWRRFSLR